jgi:hypothetical protein
LGPSNMLMHGRDAHATESIEHPSGGEVVVSDLFLDGGAGAGDVLAGGVLRLVGLLFSMALTIARCSVWMTSCARLACTVMPRT